jgi:hypothetical protein
MRREQHALPATVSTTGMLWRLGERGELVLGKE